MLPPEYHPSSDRLVTPLNMLGFLTFEQERLIGSDPQTSADIQRGLDAVTAILNRLFAEVYAEGKDPATLDFLESDRLIKSLFASYIKHSTPESK